MDGRDLARSGSPVPPPTWGSAMVVSSGNTSIDSSQPGATPLVRVLKMHVSPEASSSRRIDERNRAPQAELSSPVEDFSSPEKLQQAIEPDPHSESNSSRQVTNGSEDQSGSGGGGSSADIAKPASRIRVGVWEVPDVHEKEAAQVDIDPNGDDDLVREQVARLITSEKEALEQRRIEEAIKRKRIEEEEIPSSMPSQMSNPGVDLTPSKAPNSSTPPPAKRQRRGVQESQSPLTVPTRQAPQAVLMHTSMESNVKSQKAAEELEPSRLASINDIITRPHDEESRLALVRYSQASPLVPDFLKEEIERCINKADQGTQSQSSKSDSDTQEDGYLKTKLLWVFELLRISSEGAILAGRHLESAVQADEKTLVLRIFSDASTFGVQIVDREPLMLSRYELRSNPWFDKHGHLFRVIYQMQSGQKGSSSESSSSSSILTQGHSEQMLLLQKEVEALLEEKERLLHAKDEADKKCQSALSSSQMTQETNDFLKEQYNLASSMAATSVKEVEALKEEVEDLKRKLTEGMNTIRSFNQTRIETLQIKLKTTESQLNLLKNQNRLTDDTVRQKAAQWDAYQTKEQNRLRELERRRAEVDAERASLYQSMQEEEDRRAKHLRRPPHEHFLEVDLNAQKVDLPGLEEIDDTDEVAMLRAEAGEVSTGAEAIDINAPRSSRRRPARQTQPVQEGWADAQTTEEALLHSQQQAQAEVAEALQGELLYQSLDL
jgi:hypothetical protein